MICESEAAPSPLGDEGAVRLILDGPRSGAWNMAVDEALLDSAAAGGPTTLRLYEWSAATVSLGYFQRQTPEVEPGGRFGVLPVVRRLSGGGAILHHHELTYSVVLPPAHPLASEPSRLYDEMHAGITAALETFGVHVRPRGESQLGDKTFLCFARGDRRDLVCEGHKVVGSAQRRRGRGVLQHGSILLARSEFAPEFPGLVDLTGIPLDVAILRVLILEHSARRLGTRCVAAELSEEESSSASRLRAAANHPGSPHLDGEM
jgi:lipoate-protein ligase A